MNHLAQETNPYLRQHAENPVEWFPWGPAAFAKAQAENKPIFLSVGYSTCHWCHVMARESFEDAAIAKVLNEHFVSVKVDREERPDVDRVYMAFVQATAGQGGWPMSVWLTPDLKPFYGGTYFPPQDRYGRPGFPTLLQRIAGLWKSDRDTIEKQSGQIIQQLAMSVAAPASAEAFAGDQALDHAFAAFRAQYDAAEGGFGGAPKFPRPAVLHFLFRYGARRHRQEATEMALHTLDKMAAGGIHDHLGGGFHRYSVDALWHVPHFEKMLYDQAQLALAYLEAHQITGKAEYAATTRDILDYVRHHLTSPGGGFYAAEDADSSLEENPAAHAEGAFYVWTLAEIEETLGEDAAFFAAHYGVEKEGNAPPGSDPHGEFPLKNILIERKPPARKDLKRLIACREKLLARREKRPRPHRDEKVLASWNGLMISAFARAGRILHEPAYLAAAGRAADFLFKHLHDEKKGRLLRSWCGGAAAPVEGFADDYAFLVAGLLDLFEADGSARWLDLALQLQETMDALFWDGREGGYFSTSGEDPTVLIRSREDYDGAEPAPGSVAASNLLRLADLLDRPALRERAGKVVAVAAAAIARMPVAVPQLLASAVGLLEAPRHLVIVGKEGAAGTKALWEEANRHYLPQTTLVRIEPGHLPPALQDGFLQALTAADSRATAYYCENLACRLPVHEAKDLAHLLGHG
ncbi:MAG: thioredoxin domain-containing protein [Verrucomicrobium sp.]|nr:thioredoxin domain-containing protein [Verrucomicrobium sp.]